ncbi:spore coat protein U domain-containing protein, partial [Pseudomonas protegens]|nr:spore coat protein U domain-containing protein [Pseudomonas protegens]
MNAGKGWRQAILGLLASVLSCTAQALCTTVPTAPAGFGTVSSILVRTTSQPASTTNAGLSCTGSLLSILASNDHFYATITSTTSGMVGPTGDVISYT